MSSNSRSCKLLRAILFLDNRAQAEKDQAATREDLGTAMSDMFVLYKELSTRIEAQGVSPLQAR